MTNPEPMTNVEFEDAVITTQAGMSLVDVQALTNAETLADALRRLTVRGNFRD